MWQHQRIRVLLEHGRVVAEAALDGKAFDDAVASAVGDIRSTEIHLSFEETVLLPLLRDDLPIGPQRADRLLDEHARQRASLAALHDEARAHPELPMLAAKLAFLTEWLLADMAEEEHAAGSRRGPRRRRRHPELHERGGWPLARAR